MRCPRSDCPVARSNGMFAAEPGRGDSVTRGSPGVGGGALAVHGDAQLLDRLLQRLDPRLRVPQPLGVALLRRRGRLLLRLHLDMVTM